MKVWNEIQQKTVLKSENWKGEDASMDEKDFELLEALDEDAD